MEKNIFKENKNLKFDLEYYNKHRTPYVSFIPYNRTITLNYIKKWLKKLCKEYDEIVIYAQGFNFDGLNETNKDLIKNGCVISNQLTGEQTLFKGMV